MNLSESRESRSGIGFNICFNLSAIWTFAATGSSSPSLFGLRESSSHPPEKRAAGPSVSEASVESSAGHDEGPVSCASAVLLLKALRLRVVLVFHRMVWPMDCLRMRRKRHCIGWLADHD